MRGAGEVVEVVGEVAEDGVGVEVGDGDAGVAGAQFGDEAGGGEAGAAEGEEVVAVAGGHAEHALPAAGEPAGSAVQGAAVPGVAVPVVASGQGRALRSTLPDVRVGRESTRARTGTSGAGRRPSRCWRAAVRSGVVPGWATR